MLGLLCSEVRSVSFIPTFTRVHALLENLENLKLLRNMESPKNTGNCPGICILLEYSGFLYLSQGISFQS